MFRPHVALTRFLRQEDGPTAVEYAVVLAMIIVVVVAAVQSLGANSNQSFASSADAAAPKAASTIGTASGLSGSFTKTVGGITYSYDADTDTMTENHHGGSGAVFTHENYVAGAPADVKSAIVEDIQTNYTAK